jgi:hypothetical protein
MGATPLSQAVSDLIAAVGDLDSERKCERLALATCMQRISAALDRGWTPETRRDLRSAHRMAAAALGVEHE